MVKEEIVRLLEEEAKRSGINFEPYREMLQQISGKRFESEREGTELEPNGETSQESEEREKFSTQSSPMIGGIKEEVKDSTLPESSQNTSVSQRRSKIARNVREVSPSITWDNNTSWTDQASIRAPSWTCPACFVEFFDANELIAHLEDEHVSFVPQRGKTNACALRCPKCVSTFVDTIDSLLYHYDTVHGTRFRLITEYGSEEAMAKLVVRVNKRHITVIRPAYGDEIFPTKYKHVVDLLEQSKDNRHMNLLREEGAPLSRELTMMVAMSPPGKKTVFNAPNTCPVCAKVMHSQGDFIKHMHLHEGNALEQWRASKLQTLKSELEYKYIFVQRNKEVTRERFETSSVIELPRDEMDNCPPTSSSSSRAQSPGRPPSHESNSPATNSRGHPQEQRPSSSEEDAARQHSKTAIVGNTTFQVLLQTNLKMHPNASSASQRLVGNGSSVVAIPSSALPPSNIDLRTVAQLEMNEKRNQRRRNLMANNQYAKTKPMSAEKLLSLSCLKCGLVFENRCKYTRHLLDHKLENNPYRCAVKGCLMTYESRVKLASHLVRKHPGLDPQYMENILVMGDRNLCGAYVVKKGTTDSGIPICGLIVPEEQPSTSSVLPLKQEPHTGEASFSSGATATVDCSGDVPIDVRDLFQYPNGVKEEPSDEAYGDQGEDQALFSMELQRESESPGSVSAQSTNSPTATSGRVTRKRKPNQTFSPEH